MTAPASGTDRLEISALRLSLTNGVGVIFGILLLIAEAIPIGLLAQGPSAGFVVLGVVWLVVFPAVAIMIIRLGLRQIDKARATLPVIEATPTEFRMHDAAGADHRVPRDRVATAAWRAFSSAPGRPALSKLEFFDAGGAQLGSWDVSVTVGRPALRWLRRLGVPARMVTGRAALSGARSAMAP